MQSLRLLLPYIFSSISCFLHYHFFQHFFSISLSSSVAASPRFLISSYFWHFLSFPFSLSLQPLQFHIPFFSVSAILILCPHSLNLSFYLLLSLPLSLAIFSLSCIFSSLPSRSYLSVLVFSAKSLSKTRRFLLLYSSVFFLSLSPMIRLPSSRLLSHLPSFLHVFRFLSSSAISVESPLFRRIIIPLSSVSSLNLSRGLNFFPNTPHTLSVTCFLFPPLNFASSLLPHFSLSSYLLIFFSLPNSLPHSRSLLVLLLSPNLPSRSISPFSHSIILAASLPAF